MKVFTEITVSGYLLQRSLNWTSEIQGKKKERKKTAKTYTNTSDGTQKTRGKDTNLYHFTVFENMTDKNNDMTLFI